MRWNPYLHAVAATAYIGAIGSLIRYISSLKHDTPDTIITSMTALSMVVFSVAVMGFLFFYRPITLLIEQKKGESVIFFAKTLLTFGVITSLLIVMLLTN